MKKQNLQRGFTLLETLLAASILAMVAAGTIALSNASLRRSADALERSIAMNLGREAIELLRSSRDSIYIDGIVNKWSDPLGGEQLSFGQDSTYNIEKRTRQAGTTQEYYSLIQNNSNDDAGEVIELGENTYWRKIYIEQPNFNYPEFAGLPNHEDIDQNDLVRFIRVEVKWGEGSSQKIETKALFTDWRFGS